jgi:FKBP-type peptidyl-prolyl cis-trans isomerase
MKVCFKRAMRTIHWLFALAVVTSACSKKVDEISGEKFKPAEGEPLPPGPATLQMEDTKTGSGREAHIGDTVKVLYTGTLMNGRKFDSTHDRGDEPAEFKLEQGSVIQGWVDGVKGMRVGGKRKLTIPSSMGYGAEGHPPDIPGGAGLKFDVELVDVH